MSGASLWRLELTDGTEYIFPFGDTATRPEEAALISIKDRFDNVIGITRATTDAAGNKVGDIVQITSGDRFLNFTYDTSHRITAVTDSVGRTVSYEYNATGRLWKVTDIGGGVTEYLYDSAGRMRSIKDPRGLTYLTNTYDANSRVSQQRTIDGATYSFAYTLNSGKVTETLVTNPRGYQRRVTFDASGNWLSDTRALGTPLEQTETVVRNTDSLIERRTDPLTTWQIVSPRSSTLFLARSIASGTALIG